MSPLASSIFRDWFPVVITLVPYWQTGQFFVKPNEKIQDWLGEIDRRFFLTFSRMGWQLGRGVRLTMEWAYSFCYPIVPLGLAALYMVGLRQKADTYWLLVLVPTYICYAVTPLFPALPPRSLTKDCASQSATKSRAFNLWILKHGSIQAISFPSAHVAAALGASLVLLQYVPVAGALFLVISFWIAMAAVVEGYHYTLDVILGAAVSLAVYLAWRL
jgi:membrane-associated phospholipid phosphatase